MSTAKKKIVKVVDIVRASRPKKKVEEPDYEIPQHMHVQQDEEPFVNNSFEQEEYSQFAQEPEQDVQWEEEVAQPKKHHKRMSKKSYAISSIIFIAICVGGFLGITKLPKVDMVITTKKTQTTQQENVTISFQGNAASNTIGGDKITEQKTSIISFPATGKSSVETKAKGTVLIFNAYSTTPQTLIATTRLETPDGKIFRLVNKVVVPGAKKTNGILEPSSVEAQVIADKAGDGYNVDPVDNFSIPGFKGTDKFGKFYAQSLEAMQGGRIGEGVVATDKDIANAEAQAVEKLKESLVKSTKIKIMGISKDFINPSNAQQFTLKTKKTDTTVGSDNKFSVAVEGTLDSIIVKESDIKKYLVTKAKTAGTIPNDYEEKEGALTYGDPIIDWKAGTMKLATTYTATFWKVLNAEEIRSQVRGKSEVEVKTYVLGLSGIDKLTASFWPFWVSHVPEDENRITIKIQ